MVKTKELSNNSQVNKYEKRDNCQAINDSCAGGKIQGAPLSSGPLGCYVLNGSASETLNGLKNLNLSDPYYGKNVNENLMNPTLCIAHCGDYLFDYAALIGGNGCRCGGNSALTAYNKVTDNNCNMSCVGNIGNENYVCGGNGVYTIYDAKTVGKHYGFNGNLDINKKLDIVNNHNSDGQFTYKGCIADSPYCYQRNLNGTLTGDDDNMTIDKCINSCNNCGFKYAGLEAGTQCFCGNNYLTTSLLGKEECSSSCSGNSSQICGGLWALSIYDTNFSATSNNTTLPSPNDHKLAIGLGAGLGSGVLLITSIGVLGKIRKWWCV